MRANLRSDVDDELRFHIEALTQELVRAGIHPSAARAEAERRFGAVAPVRDACLTIDQRRQRRAVRVDRMTALLQDTRYALRAIRRTPGFSLVVALTLALGIGATTAMYAVVDGVLLRPLPYPSADRLVMLSTRSVSTADDIPVALPEYLDWKQRTTASLGEIGTWFSTQVALTTGEQPEMLQAERMSASVPRMLGATPLVGRFFNDAEDQPAADRVAVLSEDFWREHFGADQHVLGHVIEMSGNPYTIVGVFPSRAETRLPTELRSGRRVQIWLPLRLGATSVPRDLHFMTVIAQMRRVNGLAQVRAEVAGVARALNVEGVTTNGINVAPLSERIAYDAKRPLAMLLGAVGLLLLISCANVANLLLARGATRQREFAVRQALGAARPRIVSQVLVESVVRAAGGGVLGIALALAASWWMRHRLSIRLPRFELVAIDTRVLAFAFVVSLVTGLLFGLLPALRASGGPVNDTLRDGGRGLSGGVRRDHFRRSLITTEIALSFMLLVGAGLFLRSLENLLAVPRGFDSSHLMTASITLFAKSYPDAAHQTAFYATMLERVTGLPGVKRAAVASNLPIEGGTNGDIMIEGRSFPPNGAPVVEKRVVSADYFRTLGASVQAGRLFDARDVAGAQPVVIVNQTFVRRWFPNESPIGKRVDFSWDTKGLQTIVGVIADMHEGPLSEASRPAMYIPIEQRPSDYGYLVVRSAGDPTVILRAIHDVIHQIDPRMPLSQIRTLDDVVSADVAGQQLTTSIFAVFALLALLLAAVGLYGVVSYSVVQRTQELGIRAALGAQRADLMHLVLTQSAGLTASGVLFGIVGALAGGQMLAHQLFGVRATDPATFVVVAALLCTVALLASALPAFRATRADALAALRQE